MEAEEAQEKAAAREWRTPGGRPVAQGPMGIAIDGAMIHIEDEGWKEFKLASVFDVELAEREDPRTGDRGLFGHAVRTSYVVHLGGREPLGRQAWTEAHRRGWHAARDSIVLGDGAPWIWNLWADHFSDSVALVDWYHATQHLGDAKQALYPEAERAASQWYNRAELLLFTGHAAKLARGLYKSAAVEGQPEAQVKALQEAAHYFQTNAARMQYQDRRNEGWPIGSGPVESGAKQFKARVCGPGMRWSRPGAVRILVVRAAVMSGKARFDGLWQRALANSPPK
jgi:hypothetical protein